MSEKICVVAGVGPGTGAALSRRFAAGGYRVAMLARDAERLAALEREIAGSRGYAVDVTEAARVKEVVERIGSDLGTPSVLVHNAVSGHFGEFLEVAPEALEQTFRTNVLSLMLLGQAIVPRMLAAGRGAIRGESCARRHRPPLRNRDPLGGSGALARGGARGGAVRLRHLDHQPRLHAG